MTLNIHCDYPSDAVLLFIAPPWGGGWSRCCWVCCSDLWPDPHDVSCYAKFNHSDALPNFVERDGRWHHVAVTWTAAENGLTKIYWDGLLKAQVQGEGVGGGGWGGRGGCSEQGNGRMHLSRMHELFGEEVAAGKSAAKLVELA